MSYFLLQSLLYRPESKSERIALYKKFVELVEIEIFSYCNRTCWFCPNSFIDRRSENYLLPEDTYLRILDLLSAINYNGFVTYSRYNEPLSNKEIFLKRLCQAKKEIPQAKLITFTNSDYISRLYLDELGDAGLSSLFMQLYLKQDEKCMHRGVQRKIFHFLEELNLPYERLKDKDHSIVYSLKHKGIMNLRLEIKDFNIHGRNRGGTLSLLDSDFRVNPCYSPFTAQYIDYNGSVMPCCNTRSDISDHKYYILGNVIENRLYDIFFSDETISLRKELMSTMIKRGACSKCNYLDSNTFPPDYKLSRYYTC